MCSPKQPDFTKPRFDDPDLFKHEPYKSRMEEARKEWAERKRLGLKPVIRV